MQTKRPAPRTEASEKRRAAWDTKKKASLDQYREHFHRPIKSFDAFGKPLAHGDVQSELIGWALVRTGLERALNATGDPVFSDALACLKDYGLYNGPSRSLYLKVQSEIFGDHDLKYLQNMKWLLEHKANHFKSERSAAEEVAAYYFYDAKTFDAACDALRKKFSIWKRSGYPEQPLLYDVGHAGYYVKVTPASTRKIPIPGPNGIDWLSENGMIVPFNSYWRHRFRDGDISIVRQP